MYEDHYHNFFLRLQACRDVLATFAKYTVGALAKPNLHPALAALSPCMQEAHQVFSTGLSTRTRTSGQRQTGTKTEEEAAADFTHFVQDTNVRLVQPYLLDHASEESTFYPDELGGLTQSPKNQRLDRYEAYVQVLQGHAQATLRAAGATAATLLEEYRKATVMQDKSDKDLKDTITDLAPDFIELAGALWAVHCTALYVHQDAPKRARNYFAYDRLPNRGLRPKKSAATPTTPPAAEAE